MAAHQVNITDRAKRQGRKMRPRLRSCAAQRSLGRSITALIDAYEFMKGHRLKREFAAALRREVRSMGAQALKVHEMVTGIQQSGK